MKLLLQHYLFLVFFFLAVAKLNSQIPDSKFKGVTLAPQKDKSQINPFTEIKSIGSNWISLVPYAYCEAPDFEIQADGFNDWWGNTKEGIIQNINWAHESGMKVMLKPQLFVENEWPGVIDFESENEWQEWEQTYTQFILSYLDLAIEENVEMFCIGTELKQSIEKRASYWIELIENIRHLYKGQIIYSANWDSYENVPFWKLCDYISISSYFPLSDKAKPSESELINQWKSIHNKLKRFSIKKGKGLLFTEYGYHSVKHAASKHWILEEILDQLEIDEEVQVTAFESLYQTFWNEAFWKGGFIWKWYPDGYPNGEWLNKDYSPQNKKALLTIKKWYSLKIKT